MLAQKFGFGAGGFGMTVFTMRDRRPGTHGWLCCVTTVPFHNAPAAFGAVL